MQVGVCVWAGASTNVLPCPVRRLQVFMRQVAEDPETELLEAMSTYYRCRHRCCRRRRHR
jgi:hypothetical protein